jgi:type III restriction enzyme
VRILNEALGELRGRGISEERIYTNRLFLVKEMRTDLQKQVYQATEAEFRRMLADDEICFRLESSGDPELNWELALTLDLDITDDDRPLYRRDGTALERNLFEPLYQSQFNGFEKDLAWYLDGDKAIRWWHRIAVFHDYHLQGWQKGRVYPDFLICLDSTEGGKLRLRVLEAKGGQLKGSDDTEYKRKLMKLLSEYAEHTTTVGELRLDYDQQQIRFEMVLEDDWRTKLPEVLRA